MILRLGFGVAVDFETFQRFAISICGMLDDCAKGYEDEAVDRWVEDLQEIFGSSLCRR